MLPPGDRVLDLCTGTGSLAVTAVLAGGVVTAGNPSRRAVHLERTSARLHRTQVHSVRGDLTAPVAGQVFDVVVQPALRPGRYR